jgi:putative flippase GtrA
MSEPEPSSSPTDIRSPSVPALRLRRHLFYYLVVGGLSVVVDIGLLALLHESYRVPLGVATTTAFCTAVVVNFLLNRTAMSSRGSRGLTQHALRYGSLVMANYVITIVVVTTVGHVSARWYLVAKLVVVAGSTSWNFLLYRHWVFTPPRPTSTKQYRLPWIGSNPRPRNGRSVERSRQMLVVVPAYNDEESVGSPGDRDDRRHGLLGGSRATGEQHPGANELKRG